jgi:lipoprotein-anchoring transpeptidase ErfK/SrfK
MNLQSFKVSHPRRRQSQQHTTSIWHDGVLLATLCFFLLGLGGTAIGLTFPTNSLGLSKTMTASTAEAIVSGTATTTPTTAPSLVAATKVTPTISPTATQTPTPVSIVTATPTWITDRYLPLPLAEKWIEVDTSKQILRAYDGENVIFTATISTGRDITQASLGKYRITQKVATLLITGPGYYLPDVPWVMVINTTLMLHGAYWQDEWGIPSNYGSINLKPTDAKWLYDWSSPLVPAGQQSVQATPGDQGTWVVIHK